jgi:hypothetical protein
MNCNDPFITYLKTFGYNTIRLPKADFRPLQLLARQGKDLDRLGDLATVLQTGNNIPLPPISTDVRAANISGQRTSDLSIGLGLSILGSVLGAMGGSKLGLDVAYKQARSVAFEFQDVLEDRIEVAKLDQFLADADVNPFSRHVAQLLEADDLYVTTAAIKSTKFTVAAKQSNGAALEVSVPVIQEIVGGNVKVSGQSEVTSQITYEGAIPLVFGFQAVQLFYDQGQYSRFKPLPTGGIAARDLAQVPNDGSQYLATEATFVSVS